MATATLEKTNEIPSRADRPAADMVVIFDGECAFCRKQIARLDKWDRDGRIAYLSLHDDHVYELWPQLSREALMQAMCLVDPDGGFHWGPDVFRYLSRKLPGMWFLAPLLHIPFTRPIQKMFYRWVARRRYQLSGLECEGGSCDVKFK